MRILIIFVAALCVAWWSQEVQPGVLTDERGWEDDVLQEPPSIFQLLVGLQSMAPEKNYSKEIAPNIYSGGARSLAPTVISASWRPLMN